jgi:hypothetical protein
MASLSPTSARYRLKTRPPLAPSSSLLTAGYILAVGTRAYVFSYFPTGRISAWSTYELGFKITDFVTADNRIWARSGNDIYLYGGDSGTTYDTAETVIDLPFIDGHQIATWKSFKGIDVVCRGAWEIYLATDPNNPESESLIGTVTDTTLARCDIRTVGESPVIKLRLVNRLAQPAVVSKIIVHYDAEKAH